MKNMKQTVLLTGLLLGTLAASPTVLADAKQPTSQAQQAKTVEATKPAVNKEQDAANKKAISDKAKSQNKLLKEVNSGVSEGFRKVVEAAKLINEDKSEEAIKALQDATGKFDIALAANPDLNLIPIASAVKVTELVTNPILIKAQTTLAKEFLAKSKIQAAKAILAPMQDDMVTRTTLLPMTTYPDAIKLATKMLIEGKKDAALATLSTAFSTFVDEVSVIPLSLLRVESMIATASELDKEKDKDRVLVLLDAASDQLEVATLLGYTDKQSELYEDLAKQIKALKKEAKGGNIVERLYKDLKGSIESLIDKKSKPESNK